MNISRLVTIGLAVFLSTTSVHADGPRPGELSSPSDSDDAVKARAGRAEVDRLFRKACRQARAGESAQAVETLSKAAMAGDLCQTRCLTESALIGLHEHRPFRDLMRRLARQTDIVLVPPDEPGDSLVVSGRVVDDDLKPVKDALLYIFHTDARGSYSSSGGNATMGDSLNPRLFGYVRTDADGRYQFRTIRPGPYPDDGPPAHIHFEVEAAGHQQLVTELMFEGDSRLTRGNRRGFLQAGFVIADVTKDPRGVQRMTCDLVLERKITK